MSDNDEIAAAWPSSEPPADFADRVVGRLGASAQSPPGWGDATEAFDALVRTDSVAGGSLVLVRDGRIAVRHDVGFQDRAGGIAMGELAIMHWGSVTKTLTAVVIMQLRDRGLLSLDDPITRWVPELRQVHNPFGSMDGITLRMLLSHSSGFQNPTRPWRRYVAWEPFEPTRWEQLVGMMPYQEIRFSPGSRYGYSNPAFIYLARVIESITGDPYQSYIYKNLWFPLRLERSSFGMTRRLAPRRPALEQLHPGAGQHRRRAGGGHGAEVRSGDHDSQRRVERPGDRPGALGRVPDGGG